MKNLYVKYYVNPYINKGLIYKENINKSGIYLWKNELNGKCYVGSAKNLTIRLRNYLSYNFLNKKTLQGSSHIYKALLKYDYKNFSLSILEYCDKDILIKREQYYINTLKPKYNICLIAGSPLGFKQSKETLLKYKDRKHTPESIIKIKEAMKGKVPSIVTKTNQLLATGYVTVIINKEDNSLKKYNSLRSAARSLNISRPTLLYYSDNYKPYKNIYLIIKLMKIKFSL